MKKQAIKIITIGGGSSYTPELAEGLINQMQAGKLNIKEWWLVDINEEQGPQKLKIIVALVTRMFAKAGLPTKIYGTLNRKKALKGGADFVTTQLRVGRMAARIKDERIPLSHGFIGQETNGAGGLFKGLRTIPVIYDIIKDVKKYANGAWIVNFTNPVGIVTQAVASHGDYQRFIGVCNIPISNRINVANYLGVPYQDIKYNVAGLNHFVYFTRYWVKNKEVTKRIMDLATNPQTITLLQPINVQESTFDKNLIEGLQALPCGYHMYYYNKGSVLQQYLKLYQQNKTRAEEVEKIEKALFKKYQDKNLDVKPKELEDRGGAHYSLVACAVIEALHNDTGCEVVVSAINKGRVKNFPNDLVVEATSKITKNGVMPVDRDIYIPEGALPHVKLMKEIELLATEAVFHQDASKALLALQINPLSEDSHLAKKVFNDLVKAHAKYLKGIKVIR